MPRPYIMVAPTGARRSKADHPALPLTIPEITETAAACHSAGADALHLHIRDDDGRHSLDPGRYHEALSELAQQVPSMRVQITTESGGRYDVAAQLDTLRAVRPGWASIALREIARDPALAPAIYGACAEYGTEVQNILHDPADFALLSDWRNRGIIPPEQTSLLFVLGRYDTGQPAHPGDLTAFLDARQSSNPWMVCAFGPAEHDCLLHAAARGGQLRVGFENSLCTGENLRHKDNAASVARLVGRLERNAA